MQRVSAEYANYRKRVERDRGLVTEQATGSVLAALLPILDDLDRAREHGDLVGPFGSVAEQLVTALGKFGLTPFGEQGDPFDPTRHEAVAHQTSADVTEPTCVQVMRRGYQVGERLLRPALVASRPGIVRDGDLARPARRDPAGGADRARRWGGGVRVSSKDWIEKDYYAVLGVAKAAPADEIKKAYRKLARESHPDHNPGDAKAEERFKAVSEAYAVLGDDAKRREYDEMRSLFGSGAFRRGARQGGQPGGVPFDVSDLFGGAQAGGGRFAGGNISDLFSSIFSGGGGAGARGPARGRDIETEVALDFDHAVRGVTLPLTLRAPVSATPATATVPSRHRATHLPGLPRRRGHQPEPGRVQLLRALPQLSGRGHGGGREVSGVPGHGGSPRPVRSTSAFPPGWPTASGSGWPAGVSRVSAAARRVICSCT